MARGNVETVQRALDAWGRRDSAAIRELFDEQAEFHSGVASRIEGGIYRGHADTERYFADLDEAFEEWHTEDERCLDLGGGRVLLLFEHSFSLFGAEDIDGAVENMDPDVEWEHQPGTGAPEEGVYRGREQVRRLLERLREAWQDFHVDVRDVVDAGAGEYVVKAVIHARGRISDIALDAECEYVLEFRDSKAVRVRFRATGAPVGSTAIFDEEKR
jgi:ketosteroid isomerase-like protein